MQISTKEQFDNLIGKLDSLYIYGAGKWGKEIVDYLYEIKYHDKIRKILVSSIEGNQNEYRQIPVVELKKENCIDACILICVKEKEDICKLLIDIGIDNYVELENIVWLKERKQGINISWYDFVVAGWPKCGTTTLHAVMKKNKNIYLPEKKETLFYEFRNKVENPVEILKKVFFEGIENGQMVGSVEPSFYKYAELVKKDFGGNIKVILILRNPVLALFSLYKMQMKKGNSIVGYGNYQEYTHKIFDEYCEKTLKKQNVFFYEKYVKEFVECFGMERIHIVFLEELIQNPKKVVDGIYRFIGVEGEYDLAELPKENEGNFVFATKEGYLIAKETSELAQKGRENPEINVYDTEEYKKILHKYMKSERIYNPQMKDYQKEKLQNYFYDSVRNLEQIIDRDLKEIWF